MTCTVSSGAADALSLDDASIGSTLLGADEEVVYTVSGTTLVEVTCNVSAGITSGLWAASLVTVSLDAAGEGVVG